MFPASPLPLYVHAPPPPPLQPSLALAKPDRFLLPPHACHRQNIITYILANLCYHGYISFSLPVIDIYQGKLVGTGETIHSESNHRLKEPYLVMMSIL